MYIAVCSAEVRGGPLDVRFTNRTDKHTWDHRTYATFWNILWLIFGLTRQPLDRWTRTTRRTKNLEDTVLCEYLYVFLTYYSRLPPQREVEFGI
jgi:hypothetical protein